MTTTADLARPTEFVATYADEVTARRKSIKGFAVAYEAFMTAARANNMEDAKTWGLLLKAASEELGIPMVSAETLADYGVR